MRSKSLTSFLPAITSNASINRIEGAFAAAVSKTLRILSSDSPDVPPMSSGPETCHSKVSVKIKGKTEFDYLEIV